MARSAALPGLRRDNRMENGSTAPGLSPVTIADVMPYSHRNAVSGSVSAARRAGK